MSGVDLPVARVVVDVPLPHLDRPFDYAVPADLSASALVGTRVRVRFSGRLVHGFIIDRVAESDHRLQPLERVLSDLPVLTPEVYGLCRAVADHYAGTLADVLRAAVPPRHARAEASVRAAVLAESADPADPADASGPADAINPHVPRTQAIDDAVARWGEYSGGAALVRRIAQEQGVRAAWCAASTWPEHIAALAAVVHAHGRGTVIVAPDARDISRLDAALTTALGPGQYAVLTADAGPQRRFATFCRILLGRVRVVLGTRAAAFAPVVDPGLLICWDDADESLSEPHAPGWHAREVLALRAHANGAALVVGGASRTCATQMWVETGWAASLVPRRDIARRAGPRVRGIDAEGADGPGRVPRPAWTALSEGLARGPVLVQVARRGYVPGLACQDCRAPARCVTCGGPLALGRRAGAPTCAWCGTAAASWHCAECGGGRLRARSVGAARTAEELGRAFPGVPVVASMGEHIVDRVPDTSALVVATPGAEPVAEGGYSAIVLADAEVALARPTLRAGEEAARRWFATALLARPQAPMVIVADPATPLVQALVRADPVGWAERDLAERTSMGLPPVTRAATLTGSAAALEAAAADLPARARVVGPLPIESAASGPDRLRLLVTIERAYGTELTGALHRIAAGRTARRDPEALEIRVDPIDWGG